MDTLRPRDWDNVLALGQHPGQRQLRRRAADFLRDSLHRLGQMQITLEVLTLEPGMATPPVVLGNVLRRPESSGEETTSQWAVGHKTDAQFPAGLQDFALGIP